MIAGNAKSIYIKKVIWKYLICVIVTLFILIINKHESYKLLPLLPLSFLCVYSFFLLPVIISYKTLTVRIFSFVAFLRFVLLPFLLSIHPVFELSNYNNTDLIDKAIFLMIYEIIFVGAFIYFIHLGKKTNLRSTPKVNNIRFVEGKGVMYGIIIVSILILMSVPSVKDTLDLFVLNSNTGTRLKVVGVDTRDNILQQVVLIGCYISFILCVSYCHKKYTFTNKERYIYLSLVFALFIVGLIVNESRSTQVYTAFASIILLSKCFPNRQRKITTVISLSAITILLLMTFYRIFGVFHQESYITAMKSSTLDMDTIMEYAETYLLGPLSVSATMSMKEVFPQVFTLDRFVYDLLRSTMGTNFLVKDFGINTSSELFNFYVRGDSIGAGLLMPITAHGYLYFGWILSPMLLCIFLSISIYLEKIIKRTNSMYVTFFVAFVLIRTSTAMVSATTSSVLLAVSKIAISAGLVYIIQKIVDMTLKKRNPKGIKLLNTNIEIKFQSKIITKQKIL